MIKIVKESEVFKAKTRTGSEKFWQLRIVKDADEYFLQSRYWQVNKRGEKSTEQFSEPYKVEPKNIGKANETSAKKQAELEFESEIKKKIDKSYCCEGMESKELQLPMLAKNFEDSKHRITYPAYVQPKYNGQRMLYNGDIAWSRSGKQIIPEVIQHLHFDTGGYVIDGELLLPKNVLLQKTMEAVKKFTPELSPQLQFIVYDLISDDLGFEDRLTILSNLDLGKNVILSKTEKIHSESEIEPKLDKFLKEGYEGLIIRNATGGYECGHRSATLQKYKRFTDAEFTITGVVEGNGKFKNCAIFVCDNGHGMTFNCTPEGTQEHREELFKNKGKLIGKKLTIKFQELSKDRIPLFPVGICVRDYE